MNVLITVSPCASPSNQSNLNYIFPNGSLEVVKA